jgi:hypothetical protein
MLHGHWGASRDNWVRNSGDKGRIQGGPLESAKVKQLSKKRNHGGKCRKSDVRCRMVESLDALQQGLIFKET